MAKTSRYSLPSRLTRVSYMLQARYLKNRYLVRGRGSALHGSAVALRSLRSGDLDLVADMGLELVGITGELMFFTAAIREHVMVPRVWNQPLTHAVENAGTAEFHLVQVEMKGPAK